MKLDKYCPKCKKSFSTKNNYCFYCNIPLVTAVKEQHSVPVCYLRGFAETIKDKNPYVYLYELNKKNQQFQAINARDIAKEKNLYEFKDDDGNFLERNANENFYKQYEDEYKKKIQEINDYHSIPESSYDWWIEYLILQLTRTPYYLGISDETLKEQHPSVYTEKNVRNASLYVTNPALSGKNQIFQKYIKEFEALDFQVYAIKEGKFITCDNPVVVSHIDSEISEVLFTATDKICFHLAKPGLIEKDEYWDYDIVNSILLANAQKYLFSSYRLTKKYIKDLRNIYQENVDFYEKNQK